MIKAEDLQIVAIEHGVHEFEDSMHAFAIAHAIKDEETVQGLVHRLLVMYPDKPSAFALSGGHIELRIMVKPKDE